MSGKNARDALGSTIKPLRFHHELSQADLAEKAGISITFLRDIERGNKCPYPDTLANLAHVLKSPVYEFLRCRMNSLMRRRAS
ncbi:MAG: helix-turn-helix domain-containing protein [Treponema sp.]|nr:helix-turn-helix domain-containing protein [Treponema sp.]